MISQKLKFNFFLFFFAILCFSAFADEPMKSKMRPYSTEDGLSHDGVLCITKDSEGFMWFGTWDGINRFDGTNFVTYKARPGDQSKLKNNKIRNIVEDKHGYLWIKTYDNKVYRFDKSSESFLAITATTSGEPLNNIVVEKTVSTSLGDTWLLTEDQGLVSIVDRKLAKQPFVYNFQNRRKDKFKIPSNHINFLFEDANKKVWAGSDKGLFCLAKTDTVYRQYLKFKNGSNFFKPNQQFTCADGKGNLVYFGTATGEIIVYDAEKLVFRTLKLSENVSINDIKVAKSGVVYITTTGKGLAILNPKTLAFSYPQQNARSFMSIYEDRLGNIWLEPEFSGIVKYNPSTQQFKLFTKEQERKTPNAVFSKSNQDENYNVFEDINGVLWTNLKGGGFGYYDVSKNQISDFTSESGSGNQKFNDVVNAYSDQTGVLWLSTRFGGINKFVFPPNNFSHKVLVPNSNNRFENEVRAIFEDSQQRLWVSTKIGQLYVFDKGKKIPDEQLFTNIKSNGFGSIYTIIERKNGSIWIGTKGQGLIILNPTSKTRNSYKATRYLQNTADSNSLSSNMIYALLEDKAGLMWVGTFGGGINQAVETNGKMQFKTAENYYKNYPIKTCNVIRHLEEGENGVIWIATTDGLLRFNPQLKDKAVFYRTQKIPGDIHSLGNNDVQYIYKDNQKQMWAGTFGGGLNKVKDKPSINQQVKFDVYTKEQGLPNDIVLNILDDGLGNLWMATEYGLSKFNKRSATFRNFDSYEGLPKEGFSEASSFKMANGALCFGSINGYITFFPSQIKSKKYNVSMALTNLQLFNHDINAGATGSVLKVSLNSTKKLELNYDQNVINIDYAVLDYRTNYNLSYAYILEGYDKQWHYVKNQTRAFYNRLPPGNYVFKVKSLNNDLFSNIPTKSVAIHILPPFWLTNWAYLGYFVVAIFLVMVARNIIITMIKLRNKVVLEHKLTELKLQFFTNISHELRTPLTLIISPLKKIGETEQLSAKGEKYLAVVTKNANRMVRFVNQLLDFRKIQSGNVQLKYAEVELIALVKEIAGYFKDIAEEKKINFLVHADVDACAVVLDEEKMDIVIYNLLSNAFKFTPAGKTIEINISCLNFSDKFTIEIIDEGVGVPEGQLSEIFELYYEAENQIEKGSGIGLALAKSIIVSHHGQITAQNNEVGMSFKIELPKGNSYIQKDDVGAVQYQIASTEAILNKADSEKSLEIKEVSDLKQKPTILLVEDNTELRSFLADQLVAHYLVNEACDGEEGLVLAKKIIPDLIISDVMMPNMDGIELLDNLKNSLETSHIPVILLTAKSAIENQITALKYGADFYITKPFDVGHILASMENLIKQRKNLYQNLISEKKVLKLEPSELEITSKDETFLKDVIAIVENAMADPQFNIDSVAVAIGMGRTTFYKKLKCLTQRSPVEFVRDMRLKRGKQLLDRGEHNISEIAYMIGFSSSGYFSTCFKEAYKISPSDYLKEKVG
jgi:signal transduction histidine kinase/ligand-binding sensor domain-containing protein/CheY-like chemotaxis protein/AraC-like DNA-binding protein